MNEFTNFAFCHVFPNNLAFSPPLSTISQAIDIAKHHVKKSTRREIKTENPYHKLLIKLYSFLQRRTESSFNAVVLKRLNMGNTHRPSVSIATIAKNMAKAGEKKTAVVVGTVTDDIRFLESPKLCVAALKFSKTARARIVKAGGECITLDQLALRSPTGANTVLLRGKVCTRESVRHFGHGKGVAPRIRSNGRKFERARGRR